MKNADVKELFKMVPHGATVTIVQNNRTFRSLKSSVKKFQKDNKLYVSGVINRQVYDLIIRQYREPGKNEPILIFLVERLNL